MMFCGFKSLCIICLDCVYSSTWTNYAANICTNRISNFPKTYKIDSVMSTAVT